MSGATESLGLKIAGAKDLKAVVRSMKAQAAASIGQYERAVGALDKYYRTVELGLMACLKNETPSFPAITPLPNTGATVAIIFGSDQGLVGRFNDVLMEFAIGTLKSLAGKTQQIWSVGERMQALIAEAGLPAPELLIVPNSVEAIPLLVGRILIAIEQTRERSGIREVYVFHNRPKSAAVYEPVGRRLLPLDAIWKSNIAQLPWPTRNLPQVIEETEPALEAFIREYLFVLLFQACAESLTSENASRLAAMQRAEKNIEGILDELTRTFHRVRQESIDEELFELISGYEALAQHR
jgi:F-type H+-transporting ATPase subunit gamma